MKKKLEAELISLAHRILQLKNKEDIAVLQEEARKLYEKLSVLRFAAENLSEAKPTIGQAEIEEKLEQAYKQEEKVVVGEIPSADELEDMASAEKVSELVGNLAASKSVTDEPISEEDKSEVKAGEETEVQPEAETSAESVPEKEEISEDPETEKPEEPVVEPESEEEISEEVSSEEQPEPQEDSTQESESEKSASEEVESPTLEEGKEFVPAEASEEIKLAQEAQQANELFWEAKPETQDEPKSEQANEKKNDIFEPKFELSFDEEEKPAAETPAPAFTFDDLLGKDYADPVFVTPEELKQSESAKKEENKEVIPITRSFDKTNVIPLNKDERGITLNDKLSKGITIGLNDRIAFMKHLFNNSSEDYNRVLSQLITFDNFTDARDFIDTMVKPDYDNWKGKEEYEQRFLEIIEKRFQ